MNYNIVSFLRWQDVILLVLHALGDEWLYTISILCHHANDVYKVLSQKTWYDSQYEMDDIYFET